MKIRLAKISLIQFHLLLLLLCGVMVGCDQNEMSVQVKDDGRMGNDIVLMKEGEFEKSTEQGLTIPITELPLIQQAIIKDDYKTVSFLIKDNVNINEPDSYGQTALFYAIDYNRIKILKLLLDNGASVLLRTKGGETSLMRASSKGSIKALSMLIKKGSNVNDMNNYNMTALHYSIVHSSKLVRMLLDSGADIDAKTKDGGTALMAAARSGKGEVVSLLLERGASTSIKDNNGKTALQHAKETNQIDIIKLLNTKQ